MHNCQLLNTRAACLRCLQKEKEASGLPDVAGGARNRVIEVELAVTEDRKLRGQLKNPNGIETQVTAIQIAALKGIGKGTRIFVLDRYGNVAASLAKELSSKGFGKVREKAPAAQRKADAFAHRCALKQFSELGWLGQPASCCLPHGM